MKITIKGSPKEISELAVILQARQTAQSEKDAPQEEATEQGITFGHFKPRFEDWIKRAKEEVSSGEVKERHKEIADTISALNAKAAKNAQKKAAPQAEAEEQEVPFLVRDLGGRGHRKKITSQSENTEQKIETLSNAVQNGLDKATEKAAPQEEAAEHQENKMLSREEARKIVKSMDAAGKEALKFLSHTP